ncbi:MAG: hypothetical protein ACOCYR_08265 [Erythrobacter sp.]|uniref:hypothetical protein n=1 Tax=Erythrobacter sp. HL-111 TaxID=1798193 RepID=UPI0006DABE3F|nr:hypothetical protein [Erythrobacter sp. HL-111]KPP85843.1 MAG: hypothetical protein HLUCCO15_13305 [Erythrobacteraceae bacterium HL-111]SDS79179.1 hypothetical protein SAMN04515621_2240 [Erythrobacter sp. HL-111]
MRRVRGPRPPAVNAFAAMLLALAAWNLATALWDLPAQAEILRSLGLGFEWNRDWTIVASSAWFTVELIPIAAVWLLASRFARGFITAMALVKVALILSNLPMLYALPGVLLGQSLSLLAVALLYTRAANAWFARRPEDPAVFE